MKLSHLIIIVVLLFAGGMNAQVDYSDFVSGEYDPYKKVAIHERLAPPHVSLREADVKFSKRIIRCIDVRQKMNKAMEWPKSSLSQHLLDNLWEGNITPYSNDSMASPLNTLDYRSRLQYEQTVSIASDPDDIDDIKDTIINVVMTADKIKKFWVMEDWYFDAKLSVFKPVIVGLAPVYQREFATFKASEQPLCWIKVDQRLRDMMSHWEYFNRSNNAARLNYDDLFEMRLFDSYIVYESNVFDNYINQFQEYENNKEAALLKADEVKNDLFIFEHDLWQF